jgi:DHA1 family inner membrane transport protein
MRSAVLGVLFAGAFVMGCAEMLVVGMLDLLADDLSVSVSAAGSLVTANALGLAVGGPLATWVTSGLDRRTVLLGATVVFLVGNLLPALGAGYPAFLVVRVVVGAAQGLFIAAAFPIATSVVEPERSGRAMATVISGFASASAVGLPLGTLLGQTVGWRGAFVAVVAGGVAVLVAAVVLVPSLPSAAPGPEASAADSPGAPERAGPRQLRHALAPKVLAALAVGLLMFAGIQSALTYLVPFLDRVTGVSGAPVSGFLMLYGCATAVASYLGGRFADADAARALVVGALGVAGSLVLLRLGGASAPLAALAVLGMGVFGMGAAPSLQHRVVALAGEGATLAASLPASSVNVGIALGSLAGGAGIEVGGVAAAVVVGVAIALLAVGAAVASGRQRVPQSAVWSRPGLS